MSYIHTSNAAAVKGPWHSHAATVYRDLSSDKSNRYGRTAVSLGRGARDAVDGRRRVDHKS